MGKQAISRERESCFQGKVIPERENFLFQGKFAQFSLGGKILPQMMFREKKRADPEKSKGFALRGTPKILGKKGKNAPKKQGKSENNKSKEIEKSKDWRVRLVRAPTKRPTKVSTEVPTEIVHSSGRGFSAPVLFSPALFLEHFGKIRKTHPKQRCLLPAPYWRDIAILSLRYPISRDTF